MKVVAITGGGGFVGRRLAASLLDDHGLSLSEVRLLDVRCPVSIPFAPSDPRLGRYQIEPTLEPSSSSSSSSSSSTRPGKLRYVACDLRDSASVHSALASVDTVLHLASFGMSGKEMLDLERIRSVNLGGTKNIIEACREMKISRLIYVSTYNVVFGTKEILNGSEDTVPYYPLEFFHDEYSRTKRLAEEMVLKANSKTLSTCAIRPGGIYGDGEERHFPRILNHVRLGLGFAAIGSPSTLCDWTYVDNLCHALILAATSLTAGPHSPAAGQAYAISDDKPLNNFEFLRPLCEGLGYPNVFKIWIPTWLMFYMAWFLEWVRLLLMFITGNRLSFQPFLTRAEVLKVGVTHYFSMEKARRDLGYKPIVDVETAMGRCVEFYRQEYGTTSVKNKIKGDTMTSNHDRKKVHAK